MVDLPRSIASFRAAARAVVPEIGFDTLFPDDGAPDASWRQNVQALQRWRLRPRVLTGNATPHLATSLLGTPVSMPILTAPVGAQQRIHAEGEQATALGAARAGTITCVSTLSTFSLREVAAQGAGRWFQLYLTTDRSLSVALVREAEANGFGAILLTVDNVAGFRQVSSDAIEVQAGSATREKAFWSAGHCDPSCALRIFRDMPAGFDLDGAALADLVDNAPGWADVEWLTEITPLPVVVKGVQTVEDAILASRHGARGIVVSNHGGASPAMEGLPSPLFELREIARTVGDDIEIYYDGGIQTGQDVLKALALGARAVLVGRAVLWGLAVAGADGVEAVLETLKTELRIAMAICGVADIRSVPSSTVAPS